MRVRNKAVMLSGARTSKNAAPEIKAESSAPVGSNIQPSIPGNDRGGVTPTPKASVAECVSNQIDQSPSPPLITN